MPALETPLTGPKGWRGNLTTQPSALLTVLIPVGICLYPSLQLWLRDRSSADPETDFVIEGHLRF